MVGSLVLAGVGTFVVVGDRARAGARRVHVVNATAAPATVTVGDAQLKVVAGGLGELALPEGDHVASVQPEGGEAEQVAFSLSGSFMERYLDRTVFVLNVGGAATLLVESEEYGAAAAPKRQPPRILQGEPFMVVPEVDYAFAPFPETVSGAGRVVVKTRVDLLREEAGAAVKRHMDPADPAGLDLAEQKLDPAQLDEVLLADYLRRGSALGQLERVKAFLAGRLDATPTSISWHRAYQDLVFATDDGAALAALGEAYVAALEANPADGEKAALSYLQGRLQRDEPRAREASYQQAVAFDPEQPFANYALAVLLQRRGELAEAKDHAAVAAKARPGDAAMDELAFRLRFAAGEFAALKEETAGRQTEKAIDLLLLKRRVELEAALGDPAKAKLAAQAYRQRVQGLRAGDPRQLALHAELVLLDVLGQDEERRTLVARVREPIVRDRLDFQACLMTGALEAAEELHAGGRLDRGAALFLSLAWAKQGDAAQATAWRDRAAEDLAQGTPGQRGAAALLTAEAAPSLDDVWALNLPAAGKAALLRVLADGRAPWLEASRRMASLGRTFPHRLLAD
jgi:hypothetical protein